MSATSSAIRVAKLPTRKPRTPRTGFRWPALTTSSLASRRLNTPAGHPRCAGDGTPSSERSERPTELGPSAWGTGLPEPTGSPVGPLLCRRRRVAGARPREHPLRVEVGLGECHELARILIPELELDGTKTASD